MHLIEYKIKQGEKLHEKIISILLIATFLLCMVAPAIATEETKLATSNTVTQKTISFEEYSKLATVEEVQNMEKMIEVFEKYGVEYEIYEPQSYAHDKTELLEINDPEELEKLMEELTSSNSRATDPHYRQYTFRPGSSFIYSGVAETFLSANIIHRNANVPYSYAYYANGTPYFSSLNTSKVSSWVGAPFITYTQNAVAWTPNSNRTSGDLQVAGTYRLGVSIGGNPVGVTYSSYWQFKMTLTN